MSDHRYGQSTTASQSATSETDTTSRIRQRQDDSSQSPPTQSTESEHTGTCPQCTGNVTYSDGKGVCIDCDLVVTETQIDHGPEWRAYTQTEKRSRSRTGRPLTPLQHDKGLSTTIDWKNTDAAGNSLSKAARRKMKRLRKWQARARIQSDEQTLKKGFTEIKRMGSALNATEQAKETAAVLYRKAHSNDLLRGRSAEGVASASLYHAFLTHNTPRSIDKITTVSRVGRVEINRTYTYLKTELSLQTILSHPSDYIPQIRSDISASQLIEIQALKISDEIEQTDIISGVNPVCVAATIVYLTGHLLGEPYAQTTVADAADVTAVTIRDHLDAIIETLTPAVVIDPREYRHSRCETDYRQVDTDIIRQIHALRPAELAPAFNTGQSESPTEESSTDESSETVDTEFENKQTTVNEFLSPDSQIV